MSKLKVTLFVYLVIPLLGLAIYANTFQAEFQFDASFVIVDNPAIRHLSNIKAIWEVFNTRFVTGLTFAFNYALGGLHPFGYHLFNITCHLFSSLLVHALVLLTFKTPLMKGNQLHSHKSLIAFFASLLFLVHPIQTQAVTYLPQRFTSLATFFYLASVVLYVKSRLNPRFYLYLGALLITLLGMFTKEITFTIPLMLLLYDFSFFGLRGVNAEKRLLLLLPFLLTLTVIPISLILTPRSVYEPFDYSMSYLEYSLTQFNVIRTYLRLLFLPIHQNLDYDYPISRSLFEPSTFASFLLFVGIGLGTLRAFKRQRLLFFCISWFFLALSVESTFFKLRDVIFEHRLYLPMVGFSIFLSASLCLLLKDVRKYIVAFSVIILIFSISTYRRNEVWKDEVTLWQDVVKKSPQKARPFNNLGLAYGKKGYYDQAIKYCRRAIELNPRHYPAFHNLGHAYEEKGNYEEAIRSYQKALEFGLPNADTCYRLGETYGRMGDGDKAIEYYQKAIGLDPAHYNAYNDLGIAYGTKARYDQAVECFRKAIRLEPTFTNAHNNLGIAYLRKGDETSTLRQVDRLRALKRDDLANRLKRLIDQGLK